MTRRRLAELCLFGAAAAGPAVVALPLTDQFALPKLALGLLMSGMLLALLDVRFVVRRWLAHPFPVGAAAALLFALAIATVLADYPRQSVIGTYTDYNGLLYYIPALVAFCAAAALVRSVAALERLVSFLAIGAIPVLAYAIVQSAGADPVSWDIDFGSRVFSTLGQPLVLGGYLATLLPVLVWLGVRRHGGERMFLVAEGAVTLAVLIATGTRGAYIAVVVAAIVGITPLVASRGLSRRRLILAGVCTTTAVVVAVSLIAAGVVPQRLRSPATLAERKDLWRGGIHMAADRPLTGWGPDQFANEYGPYRPSPDRGAQSPYETPAASPHNETLMVLLAGGLPALLAYAAMWVAVLLAAVRAPLRRPRMGAAIALGAALAAYLAQAQFSIPDPSLSVIAMTLLGGLAGLTPARRGIPRAPVIPSLARWAPRVAGFGLAAVAFVTLAADYVSERGNDAAALRDARLARTINPLQARYLDELAAAHEASTRWGVSAETARRLALESYDRRIVRFGGGASTFLDAAGVASRDRTTLALMEQYLVMALAADPLNPGAPAAIEEIRRGAAR